MSRRLALACIAALAFVGAAASAADQAPALSVIGTIAGPDGRWDFASIDAAKRKLYVARGDGVMVVDLETQKVTPAIVPGARVHGVILVPGKGRMVSTNGETNTATLFDTADGKVIAQIPTGIDPDAGIYDPSTGLVLVMDSKGGDATLIDPVAGKVTGTIAVGGELESVDVDGKGRAYVAVEDKNEVAVLDIAQKKTVAHYKLDGCDEPSGLVVDPRNKLIVVACGNNVAKVVSITDGKEIASLPIGPRPDAAIFDQAGGRVFIPCGDGTMATIAIAGPDKATALAPIQTKANARTGAFDSKTGRLYLPTATMVPATTPGARPTPAPGSFVVLIVGTK